MYYQILQKGIPVDKEFFDKLFIKFIKEMKVEYDKVFHKKIEGIYKGIKIRGNNPSLSNVFEDKFTDFISSLFPNNNFLYLIDVSLTTKLDNQSKTIRPDIIIVDKSSNSIQAIFELKIDDARAQDDWVEMAQNNMKRLKKISINNNNSPKSNFIQFRTIKLDAYGNPIKKKTRANKTKFEFDKHILTCNADATIACFTLCEENSRRRTDGKMRTEGTNASYLSIRHFNNQIYSEEDFINEENLYIDKVFQILKSTNLGYPF